MGVAVALAMCVAPAMAQDAGAPGTAPAVATPAEVTPDPRAAQVWALIDGSLDVDVSPDSLFEISLEDEAAIQVEATRLRALIRTADEAARLLAPPSRKGKQASTPKAKALRAEFASVDPALWEQRVELDRARLAFYSLGKERREALLLEHAARQEAARPRETDEERRAREAEEERARALEAARVARSEAERLVAEELAHLIEVESAVYAVREDFQRDHEQVAVRRDSVLGWQRRVRDAKAAGPAEADTTYDSLRRVLRASRNDLSDALDALNDSHSDVPALGEDPLIDLPLDVSVDAALVRRAFVERAIAEARGEEIALREERASTLLGEIDTLNRERLGLLPHLSPAKYNAITHFTAAGLDQAQSEARHLLLIFRYHRHAARTWISDLLDGAGAVSHWKTAAVAVPLLVTLAIFLWERRRSRALLKFVESRMAAADRAARRSVPSLGRRLVHVLRKIYRPLEWLIFFAIVHWLLPADARNLLEVRLLTLVIAWFLVSSLVVNLIDALAAGKMAVVVPLDADEAGQLRLRSLRLVGRTIVVYALILVVTRKLVGEGTIFRWVLSTSWLAAIPVFLVLVRWWRETVFERLDRVRKKTPLQAWILANRSGWKSFLAAIVGAILLFGTGAIKVARNWLSGFDIARRTHAYLFRREIDRIGEGRELLPLSQQALDDLHPERPYQHWLPCPGDEILDRLLERVSEQRGGLLALIGARGMGKSSLIRAAAERTGDGALVIACNSEASPASIRARVMEGSPPRIVLLDDAQALVKPCIGGFASFDEVIAFARCHAAELTWVFAVDASVWPLLKRARDARPVFDETHVLAPWTEGQISALLDEGCECADICPTCDSLLDKLPPGADEIDRQDALREKRAGYDRMLWDHVGGNPALALQVWRTSLARDGAGVVHVRSLQVPDATPLEKLTDPALFIVRAVIQLAPATADTVVQATRLHPEEVLQYFRFGKAQGFFEEGDGGRVRVTWPWLRAVTRLLERRHLLVTP